MKKIVNILFLFALTIALFSCAKDELEEPTGEAMNGKNFEWSPGDDDLTEDDPIGSFGEDSDDPPNDDNEDDPEDEDINDDGDDEDEDRNPDKN
jgi:hypothetical protein